MATVLSGVSDLKAFLTNWSNASYDYTYGAFWNSSVGLLSDPTDVAANPTTPFTQWGNGDLGGNGVLLESDSSFLYSNGNLTGDISTLTFGSGFAATDAAGISLATDSLSLELDQSFNYDGAGLDAFDYAIYGLTRGNTLSYLYNYLAQTGAEIQDTAGNDVLVGFGGADTFVFSGGDDVIANDGPTGTFGYQDGTDTLDVSAWGVTDFSSLEIIDDGGDAYVAYESNSIQLVGVDYTVLDASDFVFASSALLAA